MSESTVVEIQVTDRVKVTTGDLGVAIVAMVAQLVAVLTSMIPPATPKRSTP